MTSRQNAGKPRGLLKAAPLPGEHRRLLPAADLAAYVEHFWCVSWDLRGQAARVVETLPHPCVHLVFEDEQPGLLGGVHRGRFTRVLEGRGRVFGIKFRPGGFYPFWKSPLTALCDQTLSLETAFGAAGALLEAGILAAQADEVRIDLAEAFLRERLPERDDTVTLIARLVEGIITDRDITRVEQVVARFGGSQRGLQRIFRDYIGISPKWMIQRYRLHEALERLAPGRPADWASLAVELGYFDQAHFIKDFKTLVGKTPMEYASTLSASPFS
ncbi:MAG: AraC family transcriptional regulator [Gammaproteobacteria bacterium]|nr:AraC family transcriptional regulator [Gammaproteobacteria bacterium]